MTPTFIPLRFNIQNSFYYLRGRLGADKTVERPKVLFSHKDVELYDWLIANVGPAEGPLETLPCKGEGWEMVGSQSVTYPFADHVRSAGVYIDDEMLAVQLKCSGVLDDRPVDPIMKMIKEMEIAMKKCEPDLFSKPIIEVDSLSQIAVTPISRAVKGRTDEFMWNFRDIK